MFLSFLFIQTYIEEPPPAAIVFHPPPQPAVPPVLHHLYLIVVSWCGVWFAPLSLGGDVCSKRTSANLIVAIPLLIAIGREGRSNHIISRAGCTVTIPSIYIVDDAVIKASERKHSLEDARVNIYTFCRLDLVHLHSQAFWQTYLACAGHRPTPYPPPRAGLSMVPSFIIS